MKNIQIQYGFIKGRELDELQKVCLDRAGKSVNIRTLQQKLDQNVSQIELEQTMELEQIMLQQASLQMNTLQQAEDRENIRKLELENAKYKDKLENAKYNFRKRKNEMLNMLDSTNPSGLEKNGYNNIRRLLCNCEQAKLPMVDGNPAEITLQEYYDNFTVKNTGNPFALIGSLVTNAVAGSNRDKYLYAVNFLRGERIDHINNIQRLEESIINLS